MGLNRPKSTTTATVDISIEVTAARAIALAKFCGRASFEDLILESHSIDEARQIEYALLQLKIALRDLGIDPR